MSKERLKVKMAVYLVLLQKDKNAVLLSMRHNTGYCDGCYSLVAGHVESEERIKEAMIREAEEEAGIILKKDNLTIGCTMYRIRENYVDFFITADKWEGKLCNAEPHKCSEIAFYPLDNLPAVTLDYVKLGIECALSGKHYIEFG